MLITSELKRSDMRSVSGSLNSCGCYVALAGSGNSAVSDEALGPQYQLPTFADYVMLAASVRLG